MPPLWNDDSELFDLCRRELFTAAVGDVMDKFHLQKQFLPPGLRPLRPDMVCIGRAMTVLEADCFGEPEKPFGLMLEALDDLKASEVYLCTGGSPRYALWGELMSIRAMKLGAAGAVVNGYSRDTHGILELGFPTFSLGCYAQDQGPRGKVIDFRCRIDIGGVDIEPGDIVFGDVDGVCIVPRNAEEEVIHNALEKVRGEKLVREAIEQGVSAADAFARYGIM